MSHRLTEDATGVYIISATPFEDSGAVDHASLEKLTEFYIGKGVSGITILGMMGEAPKLTSEEATAVIGRVMDTVSGRVPVVVGVSNPGLDNLVNLAETAISRGAAGVMVAPNAGHKTESGVVGAFQAIARRLPDVPLVFQDFPLTTQMPISAGGFANLVANVPSVVMLKHEDWPGLAKLSDVRAVSEKRGVKRVSILCGNGGLYLPQELARGADGAMTGFAYPEMLVEVVRRHKAGDVDGAEDLFDAYLPLVRHEQQPGFGLAVRKEILRRRGVIASAATRAPGPKLDATGHAELTRLMDRLEKRLAVVAPELVA
ncbi:dihydrodipicolinate synthase family protein [Acuticoccus sp. MNP-M23]|uniref:dihydrodipicolinate synthase family protein n=1 Tax=Acuticoccus sp. MNP-M23 TaxID=3072793 RepID=UPI0028153D37|nr:dihydrodipicolinate synthase family protein [Acuticoccus sp. MNP-M23]WMS44027.1 dihydrodipicolinate synthase family protein [Acuticoccus sp. MNP-M23]